MSDNERDPEKELIEFRKKWKQELKNDTTPEDKNNNSNLDEIENQARSLFEIASELERKGQVYDAMQAYRKATHLVPDIDLKYQKYYEAKSKLKTKPEIQKKQKDDRLNNNRESEDLLDLISHFENTSTSGFCERVGAAGTIFTSTHISDLPLEVMIFILKWLVSSDLDFKSLENFGSVCKGYFLLARDPETWKIGCMKIWGIDTHLSDFAFQSWREMFMLRPRVKFGGCYISKITYMRYGENSFQDQFYRPVQLVEYYRIIRFLANGKLLMLTSADELQVSINKLKNVQSAYQQKEILQGTYRLKADSVVLILQRSQGQSQNKMRAKGKENFKTFTFLMELQIDDNMLKKKFNKISWLNYKVMQLKGVDETTTEFDVPSPNFPPFYFSRVKSLHAESTDILKV